MTTTVTTKFQQRRKFLLFLPLFVIPALCIAFYALGGGKGGGQEAPGKGPGMGFNTELPPAIFDKKEDKLDKLALYKRADQDSIRRRELIQQDPYRKPVTDTQADFLLRRLDLLKRKMDVPQTPRPPIVHRELPRQVYPPEELAVLPARPVRDTTDVDPELEKLEGMLDKIIRIQHPEQVSTETRPAMMTSAGVPAGVDTIANSLPAVVQEDQVLVAGATIALRLTESVRINGISFPKDQPAYGVVSISNDRMLITVNSLRREQFIYSTSLQVYDLDGLPGIHIPGSLGRDVAKESADQGIHSLNLSAFDPSLAGQAVNAGVLTARSLLSRKVRQVRVSVKGGYQVLLRSTRAPVRVQLRDSIVHVVSDSISIPPDPGTLMPFLHRSVRHDKMELTLQGVYLRDNLLWLSLRLENHSPIGYKPEYVQWCVRDRRKPRRTAIQELPLKPVYSQPMEVLPGDSSRIILAAFQPFSLPRDKELVLQLAEGNGARALVMEIGGRQLLKAKSYEKR